jgi:hypothetical protein
MTKIPVPMKAGTVNHAALSLKKTSIMAITLRAGAP